MLQLIHNKLYFVMEQALCHHISSSLFLSNSTYSSVFHSPAQTQTHAHTLTSTDTRSSSHAHTHSQAQTLAQTHITINLQPIIFSHRTDKR